MNADVRFAESHYESARPPAPTGTLVINPPYDERMKVAHLAAVYCRIGDAMKQNWPGYTAFMMTSNADAAREVGMRPSKKIRLMNGPIRCQLLRYEIRGPRPVPIRERSEPSRSLSLLGRGLG